MEDREKTLGGPDLSLRLCSASRAALISQPAWSSRFQAGIVGMCLEDDVVTDASHKALEALAGRLRMAR
jgi:hypothetical protein